MSNAQPKIRVHVEGTMTRDQYFNGRGDNNGNPVNWRPMRSRKSARSRQDVGDPVTLADQLA